MQNVIQPRLLLSNIFLITKIDLIGSIIVKGSKLVPFGKQRKKNIKQCVAKKTSISTRLRAVIVYFNCSSLALSAEQQHLKQQTENSAVRAKFKSNTHAMLMHDDGRVTKIIKFPYHVTNNS
jgi:hypothetical protein